MSNVTAISGETILQEEEIICDKGRRKIPGRYTKSLGVMIEVTVMVMVKDKVRGLCP